MLEVKNLTFHYRNDNPVLQDISFVVPKGDPFAILGESGCGKTTLLKCLTRFLMPQTGAIYINDLEIGNIPENKFRSLVGLVFQDLHLFPHLTVLENLTLALIKARRLPKEASEEQAVSTLDRLGIGALSKSYPLHISGGQAQRVAIARALVLDPDYLFLDEPTSSLDENTSDEFAGWLSELKESTQFVVVTHDIRFARQLCPQGLLLDKDGIVKEGKLDILRSVK